MDAKSVTVGRRISTPTWGAGRIFAVDKLNQIVYIEWDTPWTHRTGRKRAHHLKWVQDNATPEAV